MLAELLLRRLFGKLRQQLAEARPSGPGEQLDLLLRRLALEAGGAALFIATAWVVISVAHPSAPISYLILWYFIFVPVLYVRVTAAATRFVLAPKMPALRLVRLDDQEALFLHRALIVFARLVGMRPICRAFSAATGSTWVPCASASG